MSKIEINKSLALPRLVIAFPTGTDGIPPAKSKLIKQFPNIEIQKAAELEADIGFTDPCLLCVAEEDLALYPRLSSAHNVIISHDVTLENLKATDFVSTLLKLMATQQDILFHAHTSLSQLRRRFAEMTEKFETLESFALQKARPEPELCFENQPGTPNSLVLPSYGALTVVRQKLPVPSDRLRMIEIGVTAESELSSAHEIRLVHGGSGASICTWELSQETLPADGLMQLAVPPIPGPAVDLVLEFSLSMFAETCDISISTSRARALPEACAWLDGKAEAWPIYMRLFEAFYAGATAYPDTALAPTTKTRPKYYRMNPTALSAATLEFPDDMDDHPFDLVTSPHLGTLLVHPVMGRVTCASVELSKEHRPSRVIASFENGHLENTGLEMCVGFLRNNAADKSLSSVLQNDQSAEEFMQKSDWAYLAPGAKYSVVQDLDPMDMLPGQIFVMSRLPDSEDASDRYAWAHLTRLEFEVAGDE